LQHGPDRDRFLAGPLCLVLAGGRFGELHGGVAGVGGGGHQRLRKRELVFADLKFVAVGEAMGLDPATVDVGSV